jgi:DNA-binding MarR family transcriptional regulator
MSRTPNLDDLSFDAVIPSTLLLNENIEPNAIKLYAFVRGLTKAHGYCFATNDYLAACMKCDISTVKRLLKSLKEEGFIQIEANKEGIHWQRHIYVGVDFKKCLRRLKNEPPPAQNQAPPSSNSSHIYKEVYNEKNIESEIGPTSSSSSAEAESLCDFFLKKIKERSPGFKDPNLIKWRSCFDLLLRIDKRCPKEARKLIEWASTHKWWKSACLSPEKLRKVWDEMLIQMNAETEKSLVQINRTYALKLKEKYPEQMKAMTFDDKYVINRTAGKEVPFNLPTERFKEVLVSLFGGTYVAKGG